MLNASRSAYQQLLMSAALKDQTVRALMTTDIHCAEADMDVQSLVDDVLLRHNVSYVPVTEGDHLLGYVSLSVLQSLDRANWEQTRLSDIFVASDDSNTVSPDTSTEDVFAKMLKNGQRKLLVAQDGKLVGMLALSDLMNFLSLQSGLGLQGAALNPN